MRRATFMMAYATPLPPDFGLCRLRLLLITITATLGRRALTAARLSICLPHAIRQYLMLVIATSA